MVSADPAPHRGRGRGRPFDELRASGLLWLINRVVFHPRGYAFALVLDEHGEVTGWELQGDGGEVWYFKDHDREDDHFADVAATFAAATAANHREPDVLPGHVITITAAGERSMHHPPECTSRRCPAHAVDLARQNTMPPGRYSVRECGPGGLITERLRGAGDA